MLYDLDKRKKREDLNEGFWDDFTNRDLFEDFPVRARRQSRPAINIIENSKEFIMEMISPGMCKKDYKLEVENDILSISGERKPQSTAEGKYTRREYQAAAFTRSFLLPEYVNSDEISARCEDGILTIHIPKKEEARIQQKRNISIS
ncbi:Hsp20/alpha crystallin family protein [Fulvivirga ulvae]|uniref:Hsp20/alpha crystallin family protein n=1 Tax=Fulvivirga ulvae TaxID=2904245 RepID=UPI001F366032|nr:Hsp20/alpha crystallin family protein [Fulvivirga ulvae]UII32064.1 Hsp20/alpha crystallin family protein [Fulvivirga ulvae]